MTIENNLLCSVVFGRVNASRVTASATIRTIGNQGASNILLSVKNESVISYRELDPILDTSTNKRVEKLANSRSKFHSLTYKASEGFHALEFNVSMYQKIGNSGGNSNKQASVIVVPNKEASLVNIAMLLPSSCGFKVDFVTLFNGRAMVFYDDLDIASAFPKLPLKWFKANRDKNAIDQLFDIEEIKTGNVSSKSLRSKTVYTTEGKVELTQTVTRKKRNLRIR